jgi:superfamily I DNA/RNA helicase
MAWAKDKVFDINATTGAIQVIDMEFVAQTAAVIPGGDEADGGGPTARLFAALSDDDLARTGLPTVLAPAVRAVVDDGELEKLQPYLPQEAFEALYLIACGYPVDTAIRESSRAPVAAPKAVVVDTTDFAAALQRPATRRQFRLVESADELTEMLDASLDRWRVFLHPNQDAIVRTTFRGPARVLGGAGTGKTVVAMHRARALAKRYPDARILFTTFSRNLAVNISGLLDTLCGPERKRIDVANIHSWAVKRAGQLWGAVTIVSADEARECWDVALSSGRAPGWTPADYEDEWRDVVQFHGVTDRAAYLKVSRAGCKKPLKRPDRAQIWEGLARYRAELDRRKLTDWADLVRKVRQHLETSGERPYRAIVVDEAQDLDAEEWRLLRALAPDQDDSCSSPATPTSASTAGRSRSVQFGINIRGRSHRLKINYRTTEQVLRWATKLLAGAEVDDLDGGSDNTVGYRSLYTGPEPEIRTFTSGAGENAFLIERVRALCAASPPEEIAVVAKQKSRVSDVAKTLAAAGIANTVLDGDTVGPGVRVATMHRVKGLDFTHVVMCWPGGAAASPDPRDQSLLYVAATRAHARSRAHTTSVMSSSAGSPSAKRSTSASTASRNAVSASAPPR